MSRSEIVALAVRAVTPVAGIVAIFLFTAGHNQPGGGFAAGLVLSAAAALRALAGETPLVRADHLLIGGGLVATAVALAPLLVGEPLLDQIVVKVELPVLGSVKTGSALVFDAGVAAIVVGMVGVILAGLAPDRVPTGATTEERGS